VVTITREITHWRMRQQQEAPVLTRCPDDTASLDTLLGELEEYGRPTIFKGEITGCWHCEVDMDTTLDGSKFSISSGTKDTLRESVVECLQRARKAIAVTRGGITA